MFTSKYLPFAPSTHVSTASRFGGTLRQVAFVVALPLASLLFAKGAAAATIVACIGEQTTLSADGGVLPADLWPGKLQGLLGGTYTVGNDVVSNANTVVKGNCVTPASLSPVPNIVVIGPFAEHDQQGGVDLTLTAWQADYQKVVDKYLALTPKPVVYVMTPPPATFVYQHPAEQTFATDVVRPAVLAVAAATPGVHVIDLFGDAMLVPGKGDGHFTAAQHIEVAQLAYNAIKGTSSGGGGMGGTSNGGAGGASSGGAAGATSAGTGGVDSGGGLPGSAGSPSASAGAPGSAGSSNSAGSTSTAGATSAGGSATVTAGAGSTPAGSDTSGCSCSVTPSAPISRAGWLAVFAGALLLRRRRQN